MPELEGPGAIPPLPQGTGAEQCQTPIIYLAAELSRETYLSWGEGHHSWAGAWREEERDQKQRCCKQTSEHSINVYS